MLKTVGRGSLYGGVGGGIRAQCLGYILPALFYVCVEMSVTTLFHMDALINRNVSCTCEGM